MITELTDQYIDQEAEIREAIAGAKEDVDGYDSLLTLILPFLKVPNGYGRSFSSDIDVLDHGDYQGTLVLIFHEDTYQPERYFATKASYGSCSGCDTIQSILYDYEDYDSERFTDNQVDQLWTEGLHLLQRAVAV